MVYIGVDPGSKGGVAIMDGDSGGLIWMAPFSDKNIIAAASYVSQNYKDKSICTIEKVWALPHEGATSSFNFGQNYGYEQGVFTAYQIPIQLIAPITWKSYYKLSHDKQQSIDLAEKLFPGINLYRTPKCKKKHDGMAEALLIANYGGKKHDNRL